MSHSPPLSTRSLAILLATCSALATTRPAAAQAPGVAAPPSPEERGNRDYTKALELMKAGRYEAATEAFEAAGAAYREAFPANHPAHAGVLAGMARAYEGRGAQDEAERYLDRALEHLVERFGRDTIQVEQVLRDTIRMAMQHRRWAKAAERLRWLAEVRRKADGKGHASVASVLNGLGATSIEAGDLDGAHEAFREARAIFEANFEPDHPDVSLSLNNLGEWSRHMGRWDEARERYQEARRRLVEFAGADHPSVAMVDRNLTQLALESGTGDPGPLPPGMFPAEALEVFAAVARGHAARKAGDVVAAQAAFRRASPKHGGAKYWLRQANQELQRSR